VAPGGERAAELVVLPRDDGRYVLAYRVRVMARDDLVAYFIDARTGEPVFRRNFQETLNSENVKQTAEFAVFDLMGRIKIKLLRSLFGSERPLERYLLVK